MITLLSPLELPGWLGLKISGRVDAFHDRKLIQLLEQQNLQNAHRVALDLSEAEFLSLQVLKYISQLNRELGQKGGELALLSPRHNIRRQIEIFLGTKIFKVYRCQSDLQRGYFVHPRSEFQSSLSEASLS